MLSLSLTHTAEYALRAMTTLALEPGGAALNARALSSRTEIPVPYLNKIMRRLVEGGLAKSAKGHGGGFRLGRPAARISYLDILEISGYDAENRRCVFGWDACRSDRPCPMHDSWSRLNRGFADWARATTLASLRPAAKRGPARR